MIFESLKVENLMGCNFKIMFDPRYTVIIGDNRQGKTLTARLIMLALYGTGRRERELHDSWKLRSEELLTCFDRGSVELTLKMGAKRYRIEREFGKRGGKVDLYVEKEGGWGEPISRRDTDVKMILEEEIGITPGLMNVVMSNEQSLIGAISYDDKLQASVWEGWKWRAEIIRGNIKKARDRCAREGNSLREEIKDEKDVLSEIQKKWIEKGVFHKDEVKAGLNKVNVKDRLFSIIKNIEMVGKKIGHYAGFFDDLIKKDNLEDENVINDLIESFDSQKDFLDEKEEIDCLKIECDGYSKILTALLEQGGREGIQDKIRNLEDGEKKLKAARGIKKRKEEPLQVKCDVYPPEDGTNLIIEIPEEVATRFKYEEITAGGIAVPYDGEKEKKIGKEKRELKDLIETFEIKKARIKKSKDILRDKMGKKKELLRAEETRLGDQKTILESDRDRYQKTIERIEEIEILIKKLDTAKNWFDKLYNELSEEESLKKIRKETVAFINRIYERIYEWDINAKQNEDRIIVTDVQGNVRSHPSGSETHIMGLSWRWMVARGFDLPLVLDEIDSLLDEKNFERTKRLIEEEMDRQTVILTLKEGLQDLPGRIYKIVRDENTSTVVEVK